MAQNWLIIRMARTALQNGRPEEALRLLNNPTLQGNHHAGTLLNDIVREFIERGERALRNDDSEGAWAQLLKAEEIDNNAIVGQPLRDKLTRLGLSDARAALESGRSLIVIQQIATLRERHVRHADLDSLSDAARSWLQAQEKADSGEFLIALQNLEALKTNFPHPCSTAGLDRYVNEVENRHGRYRIAIGQMHDAVETSNWAQVIESADLALVCAPTNREAQQIRSRAWENLQPRSPGREHSIHRTQPLDATTEVRNPTNDLDDNELSVAAPPGPLRRFYLWIDGIGGYLVCVDKHVSIGQAMGDGPIDIPIFADIARVHATLSRDDEGYLLESSPSRRMLVNNREVDKTVLQSHNQVVLGKTCRMTFFRPIAINMTAQLRIDSGHRVAGSVDGIFLMADHLILGKGPNVHITIPQLLANIVLSRRGNGLMVRHAKKFQINGEVTQGEVPLPLGSCVEWSEQAEYCRFSVENVPSQRSA